MRLAVIREASWSGATCEGHRHTGARTASPSVINLRVSPVRLAREADRLSPSVRADAVRHLLCFPE
ncbi:hypothetical protein E4P36_27785 [Streptomyces sp. 4R-3d]|nr:hypothetical protein E4P36_27785 [Streptomyces sp. 4R-3d]